MFFKKGKKPVKRVICPIPVILDIIQECIDIDAGGSEFVILIHDRKHKVGFNSDYDSKRGWFDPIFYLDEQKYKTFDQFKLQAILNGQLFAAITDDVEILVADDGVARFPWYTALEKYVVKVDTPT